MSGHIFGVKMVINLLADNIGQIDSNKVIKTRHHTQWVLRQVLVPRKQFDIVMINLQSISVMKRSLPDGGPSSCRCDCRYCR